MKRDIYELNDVMSGTIIGFDLEFVVRVMKVLEMAHESMDRDTEQADLIMEYMETLNHEILGHISSDELTELEDEGMIEIW